MMGLFIVLLIVAFVVWLIFLAVEWKTHKDMVLRECDSWSYGTFEDFMKQFKKIEWRREERYPTSFFPCNKDNNYYCHADVLKFDGVGMVLDPISYTMFYFWKNKNSVKRTKQIKKVW